MRVTAQRDSYAIESAPRALAWARPVIPSLPAKFCAITNYSIGSYVTACVGRWTRGETTEERELADIAESDRCARCVELTS